MPRQIIPIKKREVIKATRLNEYGAGVNEFYRRGIDPPHQSDDSAELNVPIDQTEDSETYIETDRTTSEVQVFDDEMENYALIERYETVTLVNGKGDVLKLQFNNT